MLASSLGSEKGPDHLNWLSIKVPFIFAFLASSSAWGGRKGICHDTWYEILTFLLYSITNCPNTLPPCPFSIRTRIVGLNSLWICSNCFLTFLLVRHTENAAQGCGQRWSVRAAPSPTTPKGPRESVDVVVRQYPIVGTTGRTPPF